jgi:nucleoside 2-deoxyribosyltransferase
MEKESVLPDFYSKETGGSEMKLYFAGPLFSLAERMFNTEIVKILRERYNYEVFLPQESEENKTATSAMTIFLSDEKAVEGCDAIVAIMDGADTDSGTCWEFGFAYALGKKLILVRTDFRVLGKMGIVCMPVNLMMSESAVKAGGHVIEYYGDSLNELASLIEKGLNGKMGEKCLQTI